MADVISNQHRIKNESVIRFDCMSKWLKTLEIFFVSKLSSLLSLFNKHLTVKLSNRKREKKKEDIINHWIS